VTFKALPLPECLEKLRYHASGERLPALAEERRDFV
jgi:hypothetical protein